MRNFAAIRLLRHIGWNRTFSVQRLLSRNRSIRRTTSRTELAPSMRMTLPHCALMVRSAVPSSAANCLLSMPCAQLRRYRDFHSILRA